MTVTIKEVTVYVASDGTEFRAQPAAERYEKTLELARYLRSISTEARCCDARNLAEDLLQNRDALKIFFFGEDCEL